MSGARVRFAEGALDDIAAVLCGAHPRAAEYLAQAPVIAVLSCAKLGTHLTYGEVDGFAAAVASEPRLKDILCRYGIPKQGRALTAEGLRLSDKNVLGALFKLNPSTLAQIIPPSSSQRSWLSGIRGWLRLNDDAAQRLPLDWYARQLGEDQSRVEQCDQLLDWIQRGNGAVSRLISWEQAMAGVERWHLSLRSDREIRRMLANKAARARYDSIICKAPIPDAVEVDQYSFVALRRPRDLRDEGVAMHHCVASYEGMVERGTCAVVSVRRDGVRIATIELRKGQMVQIKGHCNQAPTATVRAAAELYALTQWRRDTPTTPHNSEVR